MTALEFEVFGRPAPQGSKKAFYNATTRQMQMVEASPHVKPWREAVKAAALLEIRASKWQITRDPVSVEIVFHLPRPRGHYGTGKNASVVKPSAPAFPAVMPDIDKLSRSTLDALTDAGVFTDDSQVVELHSIKLYGQPGAIVRVEAL